MICKHETIITNIDRIIGRCQNCGKGLILDKEKFDKLKIKNVKEID